MKKFFLLLCSLCLLLLNAGAQSFQGTNSLPTAVGYSSPPTNALIYITNSTGSNFIGSLNGYGVGVPNNGGTASGNPCTFYWTGLGTITNRSTNVIWVQLVRAYRGTPPVLLPYGNGTTNAPQCDWSLPNPGQPIFSTQQPDPLTFSFTLSTGLLIGTNVFTFATNIDSWLGAATYVGVYAISNAQGLNDTTGQNFTNMDYGIVKKIVPIRYP